MILIPDRKLVARERGAQPDKAGIGTARQQAFKGEIRSQLVDHNGQQRAQITGYASVTGIPYEMWDMFGEYEEIVANGAFDATVAASPDVAFLVNHQGLTMARTTNGSLELESNERGLKYDAFANPDRSDVKDLVAAIDDGNITESSFAFMITEGEWSDDWMTFNILEVDIDRGDVSAVNYGANPFTSVAARSQAIMRDLRRLPAGAQRAARAMLDETVDDKTVDSSNGVSSGRSVALIRAMLEVDSH